MATWFDLGIDTHGRSRGTIKTSCPQCSPQRKKRRDPCLSVDLDQELYKCHHCGWQGRLPSDRPRLRFERPVTKPTYEDSPVSPEMLAFLERRGITREVIIRNRLATKRVWMPQTEQEEDVLAFPYLRDGTVCNVKYRSATKDFKQERGAEKLFYKYQDIDDECTIICEGEFDALSFEVAGYKHAVSVPDGAPSKLTDELSSKFTFLADERLNAVKKFVIAVDSDGPGRVLEEELVRRLGAARCWRVRWPDGLKDANEVLQKLGVDGIKSALESATPIPVAGAFDVSDFDADLDAILENGMPTGESTGWQTVDNFYRPLPGQLTVVTGIPGSGKSEFLDALMVNMAQNSGWAFGVCSPENWPPSYHIVKLAEKYIGKPFRKFDKEDLASAKEWIGAFFKFLLPEERRVEKLLELAEAMVKRHGIKGLLLDPYNELVLASGNDRETDLISTFLTSLKKFAQDWGVHVWVVAHPAKLMQFPGQPAPVPTGYSISGSAHWFNKADALIAVHRNKEDDGAPTQIHVQKIRNRWTGKLGMVELYWDPVTSRYSELGGWARR